MQVSFSRVMTMASLVIAGLLAQSPSLAGSLKLPSGSVNYYADGGVNAFFDVTLSNVAAGSDISNGKYSGWCASFHAPNSPTGAPHAGNLYDSTDPNIPAALSPGAWSLVNYVLNHKQGTRDDIQAAIWYFTDGFLDTTASAATQAMIADALAHGAHFVPGDNDIVGVILVTTDADGVQNILLEVRKKPANAVRCTVPNSPVTYYADGGQNSFFIVSLTDVPTGFDIQNDVYAGWCISLKAPTSPTGKFHTALLYNSLDTLPADLQADYWSYVNYIINHKQGTRDDVQNAIWYFTDGAGFGTLSSASQAMIADALAHGNGYVPSNNDTVAIIVITTDEQGVQRMIIECKHENQPPAGSCDDFVTGGGFIVTTTGCKANFGIHAGLRNGSLWGGLNYIDHSTKMHVKSVAVTSYTVVDATTRQASFNVTIDGQAGTAVVVVSDKGEPGTHDTFKITLSNGYSAGGELGSPDKKNGGGNIQLHACKDHGKGGQGNDDKDKDKTGDKGKDSDKSGDKDKGSDKGGDKDKDKSKDSGKVDDKDKSGDKGKDCTPSKGPSKPSSKGKGKSIKRG